MATLVEYTPKLQRAVDMVIAPLGIKEVQAPHRSGRSTFTDRKGAYSEGGGEYNGMFKCEMYQKDENTTVVRIYDGAAGFDKGVDVDAFKREQAGSCYVNGAHHSVNNYYKEFTGFEYYTFWWLKFDYTRVNTGKNWVEIVETSSNSTYPVPDFDSNTSWYLLATRTHNKQLIQNHMSGIPHLLWFRNCNEGIDNA